MRRRDNNEGSIYALKDGTYRAALSLGYRNGKARRKYFRGRTRREVKAKLEKARLALAQGLPPGSDQLSLGKFMSGWLLTVAQPSLRPSTFKSYAHYANRHLIPGLGHHRLARLSPQHVQAFLNEKATAGLAPRTVEYLRAILRSCLGTAEAWGLVARNVAKLVKTPHVERPQVEPLADTDVQAFLDAIRGDRLECLYFTALALGLRQGELLGLRWEYVDLEKGTLRVRHAMQRVDGKPTFVEPKTARSRRLLPLPEVVIDALVKHHEAQRMWKLLAADRWQEWGLVFPTTIGTPQSPSTVTHRFQKLLAKHGLRRQRFHDLRHACASLQLARGVAPRVVMESLGPQPDFPDDEHVHTCARSPPTRRG